MSKVALVTGANKGIGFETAKQLAQAGVTVLAASRNEERGLKAVETLKVQGVSVTFLQLDVDSDASVQAAYDYISNKYGKLDILVNNAGIIVEEGHFGDNNVTTIEEKAFRQTFDTNFFSVVKLTNKLLPLIEKSEAGRIVNLSSILGSLTLHSDPDSPIYASKLFAYNTSKTALNSYTIHLAAKLAGTNIKVNSAHPGWVKTELGTDAAPMSIEDGAKTSVALALLGSDGPTGKYIHLGQELPW
ncbi:SDR family oxidoreductase [Parasediminibacterium sp. JCM 36343]|uniref:SDR family oxidoreductase n=1 Tax=Parasediminibacterium sp. JCM 36343 TaxID=3374279 RepID=UPI00397E4253